MRSLIAATVAALCLALAVPGFAQNGTAAPDAATPTRSLIYAGVTSREPCRVFLGER